MYLSLAAAYLCIACEMPPRFPASYINNMSTYVNNSNFTFVFFKHTAHAKQGIGTKYAESNRYTLRHIFLKSSNMSASCSVSA